MTAAYDIRAATPEDLVAIREVLVTTWHATYDHVDGSEAVTRITDVWHALDVLRRQLDQPASCCLVSTTAAGEIIATSFALLQGDTINLSRIYILPEHQRRGLGAKILAASLDALPGATRITLEVSPENASAIAFYERHGFALVARTQNCGKPGSGLAALIYQKQL